MRILGIVHLLYEVLYHRPFRAHGLWHPYDTYLREEYESVQRVYENTAAIIVI